MAFYFVRVLYFLYAYSILFFSICVQNVMLLFDVLCDIFALEDAVSFNFALALPMLTGASNPAGQLARPLLGGKISSDLVSR